MHWLASGIYKCAANSAYDMIIFNNGSGTQTEDLSIPTVSSGYVNVYVYGTGWTTKQVASTKGTVVTKYVDESGNEIASSVSQTGEVGTAYTTTAATVSAVSKFLSCSEFVTLFVLASFIIISPCLSYYHKIYHIFEFNKTIFYNFFVFSNFSLLIEYK